MADIREFQINIPQQELDDLQRRLDQTRFPEAETPDDWSQGLPLEYAMQLRDYWESFNLTFGGKGGSTVQLPAGCSIFPKEIVPTPRSWAERRYKNIVYWKELNKGGHFAAFEQPELFVGELRDCFRLMR